MILHAWMCTLKFTGDCCSIESPTEKERVLELGKIYRKQSTLPLTNYQKAINDEAGEPVWEDPALLSRWGELQDLALLELQQKGYKFVKGKSRSKRLMSPPIETPKSTRSVQETR